MPAAATTVPAGELLQSKASISLGGLGSASGGTYSASIPIISITPTTVEKKVDTTNSGNIDTDGVLWGSEVVTQAGFAYDVKTKAFTSDAAGVTLLADLKTIANTAGKVGVGKRLWFQVTEPDGQTRAGIWNVDVKTFGDNVSDVAAFEFKITSYGKITSSALT